MSDDEEKNEINITNPCVYFFLAHIEPNSQIWAEYNLFSLIDLHYLA